MAASSATTDSQVASRYAGALFDLAKEKKALEAVAADLSAFAGLASESADLTAMLSSPVTPTEAKAAALAAIGEAAGFSDLAKGFIGTMAANGRASDVLGAIKAFDTLYADHRGIRRAVARTATKMSADQRKRLEGVLAKAFGSDVELETEVDSDLIGGIQLRVGSTLIDASVATKLDRMNTAMKGA